MHENWNKKLATSRACRMYNFLTLGSRIWWYEHKVDHRSLAYGVLSPIYWIFSLSSLVLQVSTTPAPHYPPSVSVPLCLEEEAARDPVPQVNSNAWDQPLTHRGTLRLSACLPPPLPANSLLLIDWPSHTGRAPLWHWFWCIGVDTDVWWGPMVFEGG